MTSAKNHHSAAMLGGLNGAPPAALYRQIRDALLREIVGGILKQHDQLPSESALMARFGVSRITVRQALNALQTDGVVFTLQGKGSFVSAPKASHPLARLQGLAEAMNGPGHEIFNDVVGISEVPADKEIADRLGLDLGKAVTEIRRVRQLNRAPISYEITYVPTEIGVQLARADLARRDIFVILENDLGRMLGRAELKIDSIAADPETARRLGIKRRAPVLRIERLTRQADGMPIDFEYLFYRGDSLRFDVTVERRPAA